MDESFSACIHMKEGSPGKREELVKVKDNTGTGVIVCKLGMDTFRQEIRLHFLPTKNNRGKKRGLMGFSANLTQLRKGLPWLRLQEEDSQLQKFPPHPTFLCFQEGKTRVCVQIR